MDLPKGETAPKGSQLFLLLWLSIPSGFLVVFEKPNRSSFTFTRVIPLAAGQVACQTGHNNTTNLGLGAPYPHVPQGSQPSIRDRADRGESPHACQYGGHGSHEGPLQSARTHMELSAWQGAGSVSCRA
jgi:hypothetical protein